MMIRDPAASGTPYPSRSTDSLPPGAQPPSHGASSRSGRSLEAGAAEAGPALPRRRVVELLGLRHLLRRRPEQDHVVHDVGVAGAHVGAGHQHVVLQPGVEEEAAVVVGAHAVRRRGLVRRRHGRPSSVARRRGAAPGRSSESSASWVCPCADDSTESSAVPVSPAVPVEQAASRVAMTAVPAASRGRMH